MTQLGSLLCRLTSSGEAVMQIQVPAKSYLCTPALLDELRSYSDKQMKNEEWRMINDKCSLLPSAIRSLRAIVAPPAK